MNVIDSYEKFCKAFNGGPDEVKQAELLLFIQDWIVRILDKIDEEGPDYSLDALLAGNLDKSYLRNARKDAVSRLVDDSHDAVRRISENMRENIIRENVKMPVYKVREVNSYGLNWLSRRPGATIKEKISSANSSMMAVQRRMSLDTGENRLYIAYLKELADFLQNKLAQFPKSQLHPEEESFYSQIFSIIRNPDLGEIRRWENMPPNNTLLSDQNYKKIWHCWNELKQLDMLIAENSRQIAHRISTLFYVEFLTRASQYFWFPQVPVAADYASYSIDFFADKFFGVDQEGNLLYLRQEGASINLSHKGKRMAIDFEDTTLKITVNGTMEREASVNAANIYKFADLVLTKLGCRRGRAHPGWELPHAEKYSSVIMDIFSVRPGYLADNNGFSVLKGRLLSQAHYIVRGEESLKFDVACDKSRAIILDDYKETYTVASAVEDASGFQLSKLMHLLEQYVSAQKFTFLFPDIYNEFQLSLVHKAARLVFHEVRSFPRSIGVAFAYMGAKGYDRRQERPEFLLVMDIVDTDVSFTLVQGIEDEAAAEDIPEFCGVIWERHPSLSYSIEEALKDGIFDKLIGIGCTIPEEIYRLLGPGGFQSESGTLAAIIGDGSAFMVSEASYGILKAAKINVSDKVNEFLMSHKEIIGNRRVHIISLVPQLFYKGAISFEYLGHEEMAEGCRLYDNLQLRSKVTLWRDHLPDLAIKLLYGKFSLVDHETITPAFNVEKKIKIDNVFTLAKGMGEYHFNLVQNDVNRKIRYAAVVKHPAFPVEHDVTCRLDMTYQYGAEEPYRLLFIPVGQDAGFAEAKVSWERITVYPYSNLPCPSPLPSISWDGLRHFSGKYGEQDLIFGKSNLIDTFYQIQEGYTCFDLTGFQPKIEGKPGRRFFAADFNINDRMTVIFSEWNLDTQNDNQKKVDFNRLGKISCELEEVDLNRTRRYEADLSADARNEEVWRGNAYGYSCFRFVLIEGISWKVAFYANNFLNPESFRPEIQHITFEVEPYKDNMMKAVRILDADDDKPYYYAKFIRVGNLPRKTVYGSRFFFLLHTVFTGRSTMYDGDCPEALLKVFEDARDSWVNMYGCCEDQYIRSCIFGQMSLAASDMGDAYYKIAEECIDKYLDGNSGIKMEYIGYGLGDLGTENEKSLFKRMLYLPDELIVSILSKAVWSHAQFIKNIELSKILYYFDYTIDYLCEVYKQNKRDSGRNVTTCLELLLGIFRLREFHDDDLNKRISLNNPKVQKLYTCIEDIIRLTLDHALNVKSFLKLELEENGESGQDNIYKDVPLILYAMLIFITGEKGVGDIKISGLNLDEVACSHQNVQPPL